MQDNLLDAIVAPGASAHSLLAIGGYPFHHLKINLEMNQTCIQLRKYFLLREPFLFYIFHLGTAVVSIHARTPQPNSPTHPHTHAR